MLEQFEEIRSKIRNAYDNGDLKCCIIEITSYLRFLNTECSNLDIERDLWFCYFMLTKSYKNSNSFKTAIAYANKSLEYVYTDSDRIMTYWLVASCHESIDSDLDREKAIKYYSECIEYFHDNDLLIYELCIRSNKAVLENDELEVYRIMNVYRNTYKNNIDIEIVDGMYENLFKIQFANKEYDKTQDVLLRIKNSKLKEKLSNKMFA